MAFDDQFTWLQSRPVASPPVRPPVDRTPMLIRLVGILVLVNLLTLGALGYLLYRDGRPLGDGLNRTVTARGDLAEDEKSTIELYNKTRPSVVHITTLADREDRFTLNVQQVPRGTGSGFIWDRDGHVVTNFHVIQDADAAQVTLADGSTWNAKLVGTFPDKDLAVLRIDAPRVKLQPIVVGGSDDLQVGQKVFAIGNPFGLDQTLTTGIISAVGREIESVTKRPIKGVIQTDAAINPGNSGGPLLDSAGRLIGVNTAIFSPSGTSAGIGFAIPVDEVSRVVPQLIKDGKITRPGLGVQVATDQVARQLRQTGVLITDVQPNSPAAKAGLQPTYIERGRVRLGDVLVAIDGQPIKKVGDLFDHLERRQVGETVTIQVLRGEKPVDVKVQLIALE
jgi:S1-C subfamily serine protease